MKKLFTVILLVFSVVATTLPFAVVTASNENSISYNLSEDGTYAILCDASGASGEVVIPSTVTLDGKTYPVKVIASEAFWGSLITSVRIPDSITKIEDRAFSYCYQLTSVNFSGAECALGNQVFLGTQSLASISNTSGIFNTGYGAFDSTTWLSEQINSLNNSALYIGNVLYIFKGTVSDFKVREGTLAIAPGAFAGNADISSVDLSGVLYIGKNAFENCSSLEEVNFGNSIIEIGQSAFERCTALDGTLSLPSTLKSVSGNAFSESGIELADLSATKLTALPNGLFKDCTSLEKAVLPESVTKIENYSFNNCTSLSDINASNVVSIGYDAFKGCTLLSDKSSFENVEYIASGAFDKTDIYNSENCNNVTVGKAFYKTESTDVSLTVAEGVKQISPYAFYNTTQFEKLVLPVSLEKINENAFLSMESGTVFVFSSSDTVYEDLKALPAGTVYVPDGKSIDNENITLGTINGISVTKMPSKLRYEATEPLDTAGLELALNTTLNGTSKVYDISDIGYEPAFTYIFAKSPIVTVSYGGFTTTFEVTVTTTVVVPGDANSDGVVGTDDLILMRKYVAGLAGVDDINILACELDGTDGITTNDLLFLRKIIAGLIVIK